MIESWSNEGPGRKGIPFFKFLVRVCPQVRLILAEYVPRYSSTATRADVILDTDSLKIGQRLQEDAGQVLFSAFFPPKLRTPWRRPYQSPAPYMPQFTKGIPYNELPLRRPGTFVLVISREKPRRTRLYSFLHLETHSSLAIRVMKKFFHPKDTADMSQLMRAPQLLFYMANLLLLPLLLPLLLLLLPTIAARRPDTRVFTRNTGCAGTCFR